MLLSLFLVALSPGLGFYQACASVNDKKPEQVRDRSAGAARPGKSDVVHIDTPLETDIEAGQNLEVNGNASLERDPDELRAVDGSEIRPEIGLQDAPAGRPAPAAGPRDEAAPPANAKTRAARAMLAPLTALGSALRRPATQSRALGNVFGEKRRSGDAPEPPAAVDSAEERSGSGQGISGPEAARLTKAEKKAKRNSWKFYGSSAASQGSLEFGTVGGPALMDTVPGNARAMLPDVAIVGYFAMLAGRLTGAFWANRYSPRLAYIGLMVAGMGFMAMQTGFVWIAALTLPLLMLTMGGYRYAGSASVIAENGIINSLGKNDLKAIKQTTAKVGLATSLVATALPFVSGYLIKYAGVI